MAHADWYFKDWEKVTHTRPNGRVKKELVYRGDYFVLPSPALRFKAKALAIMLIYWVSVLWLNMLPMDASVTHHGRALGLLCLAPAIVWAMGGFSLAFAPERMTYRRYHQSIRRLKLVCPVTTVVTFAALIASIYDTAADPEQSAPLIYWCLLCIAQAAAICGWVQILQHPCRKEKAN